MSNQHDYIRPRMRKVIREQLTRQVAELLGPDSVTVLNHLIEHGVILDEYAKHYVIWWHYRKLVTTTPRTPNDIIEELSVVHDVHVTTVRRIIKKIAPSA